MWKNYLSWLIITIDRELLQGIYPLFISEETQHFCVKPFLNKRFSLIFFNMIFLFCSSITSSKPFINYRKILPYTIEYIENIIFSSHLQRHIAYSGFFHKYGILSLIFVQLLPPSHAAILSFLFPDHLSGVSGKCNLNDIKRIVSKVFHGSKITRYPACQWVSSYVFFLIPMIE